MISGRLFVLKSKMNTTLFILVNKSFNVLLLYGLLIGFGCFSYPVRIKYRYKSRWLNYNVDLFVLNLWESKAILQAFSIEKTKHSQIMKLTALK
jgi:hypothetical protein